MKKFLTYAPLTKKLRAGEFDELAMLVYDLSGSVTMKIKCYRKAGTSATYSYTSVISGGRFSFTVGIPAGETFSLLSHIEVWGEYGSVQVTEKRIWTIDETTRRAPVRMGFMNTLGGIDYYTFTGSKTSEVTAEKAQYQRDVSPVTASARSLSIGAVTAYDEFEVVSDFETTAVYSWLAGLIVTPEAWIYDGGIRPVILTTKSHPVESDNLFQMKIKYRYSFDKLVQNV